MEKLVNSRAFNAQPYPALLCIHFQFKVVPFPTVYRSRGPVNDRADSLMHLRPGKPDSLLAPGVFPNPYVFL